MNPLNITHMTSPHMKVDTNLNGGWNYHGKAKPIWNAASGKKQATVETPAGTPSTGVGAQKLVLSELFPTDFLRLGTGA